MKTTIDIPEKELRDVIEFSGAKTKREAVLAAIREYNRRRRMASLIRHFGTCDQLMTLDDLIQLRESEST